MTGAESETICCRQGIGADDDASRIITHAYQPCLLQQATPSQKGQGKQQQILTLVKHES